MPAQSPSDRTGTPRGNIASAITAAARYPAFAAMFFFLFLIGGAWIPSVWGFLETKHGYSAEAITWVINAGPVMLLLSPLTAGQVADRLLSAERALSMFHLLAGGCMFWLAFESRPAPALALMFAFSMCYAPTIALTNSIAFAHLHDAEREYGPVRMWGTVGWIVGGLMLTYLRRVHGSFDWKASDLFALAGFFCVVSGLFAQFLPRTSPRKAADPLAFRRAWRLLRTEGYRTFFLVSLAVSCALPVYYNLTNPFLDAAGHGVGLDQTTIPGWMTIAQATEIVAISVALPFALPRWGIRRVFLVGLGAWVLRYVVFAFTWQFHVELPWIAWLSVAAVGLHGPCYAFFFALAFVYTERMSEPDTRASAQSLIAMSLMGIGMLVGGVLAGYLKAQFTVGGVTDYAAVFLAPALAILLCGALFAIRFREEPSGSPTNAE